MPSAVELAESVAERLGRIEGVAAVALRGSRARGDAGADSDVDLGIYYRSGRRPPLAALRRLAEELDRSRPITVTAVGEWGPWVDGGAWLRIGEQRVDWLMMNEKGAIGLVASLAKRPAGFAEEVGAVLARPGACVEDLVKSIDRLAALVTSVRELCTETSG
jgi:predicted nucleotidyltransferase